MTRFKAMLGHILLTSLGVVVGGFILLVLKGGISYLPRLDGALSPVVAVETHDNAPWIDGKLRDKARACFVLHLIKLTLGEPIKAQFAVAAKFRTTWLAPTNVDAYPVDEHYEKADPKAWKYRAVGERWPQRWCFELPATVADSQDMQISGYELHKRRPFFNTETMLPEFVIPALRP